jgi:hypothetical protein
LHAWQAGSAWTESYRAAAAACNATGPILLPPQQPAAVCHGGCWTSTRQCLLV